MISFTIETGNQRTSAPARYSTALGDKATCKQDCFGPDDPRNKGQREAYPARGRGRDLHRKMADLRGDKKTIETKVTNQYDCYCLFGNDKTFHIQYVCQCICT